MPITHRTEVLLLRPGLDIDYLGVSQEFQEFWTGVFPGAQRDTWAVDKSVDCVDKSLGVWSLTRGLTDMTTMPLYSLRGNLMLELW